MTRLREWRALRDQVCSTPEGRASYERAKTRLDAAWTVLCREGACVWWIDADSNQRDYLSGVGPVNCPCTRNDP